MYHPVCGFEHLHRHSDFSMLDGFAMVSEYAERMKEINQQYLCITDHGVMGAIPLQIAQSEKHGLFPLFGCELYVNRMQPKAETRSQTAEFYKSLGDPNADKKEQTPEQKKFRKSCHLLAIAKNNIGYQNLVRLSSWGWIHGYYYRPRVNHEAIKQYKEGIIFSSGCGISEIATAFFEGGEDAGFQMLEYYLDELGLRGQFRLEMMMLDWKMQGPYNAFIQKAADKYGLPIFLSQDCHYCLKEHSYNQRLMLMQQKKQTIQQVQAMIDAGQDDDLFVLQDTQLYLKSEEELNAFWELNYKDNIDYEIFKQAKAETVKICEEAKGVEIDRELKLPKIPDGDDILWREALQGFKARGCPATKEYASRMREEYDLICEKGYSSYFLIQKQMTDVARIESPNIMGFGDGSEAVGPGRGSACGSLVAYCLRLHDVEPIKHDLRFSRFLSPARGGKQMKIRHSLRPIPHEDAA